MHASFVCACVVCVCLCWRLLEKDGRDQGGKARERARAREMGSEGEMGGREEIQTLALASCTNGQASPFEQLLEMEERERRSRGDGRGWVRWRNVSVGTGKGGGEGWRMVGRCTAAWGIGRRE